MTRRSPGAAYWIWPAFFLLLALNFLATTGALINGDYDHIGLPPQMPPMELFNNALEALLWLAVAVLALRRNPRAAPELAVFLSGFLWFDVLTTHPLIMPIPPGFLWWGSALCLLMLLGGRHLASRRDQAAPATVLPRTPAPLWITVLCTLTGLAFAAAVLSLCLGHYDRTGLPAAVLPWHALANGVEAGGWLLAAALARAGSRREASWLALFLAGMFAWDMLSTAFLPSTLRSWQAYWGPIAVTAMLATAHALRTATRNPA